MRVDDIDIERAAHDPEFRRKVIARLKHEPVEKTAEAGRSEETNSVTVE